MDLSKAVMKEPHFRLLLSLGFFLPYPITGISPSIPALLILLPFPPAPTLNISGTQSGSIQLETTFPSFSAAAFNNLFSSLSRLPSACFFARTQAVWSSRRIRPSPGPVFADPGLGAGIEYIVPRVLYWKFFLRCT